MAELLDAVRAAVAREAHTATGGRLPVEQLLPLREERREPREVLGDDLPVALADAIAVSQCDRGELFARGGVADRRVMLTTFEPLEQRAVAASDPSDPEPGE